MTYVTDTGALDMVAIKAADKIITTRKAVDAWMMYFELDLYGTTGQLRATTTYMVGVNGYLVYQNKKLGAPAAKWTVKRCGDMDEAKSTMDSLVKAIVEPGRARLRGAPLLFQMGAVEIERLAQGDAPIQRYNMASKYEVFYGKAPETDPTTF